MRYWAFLLYFLALPIWGDWQELPGTTIDTVCPGPQPGGSGSCRNIINAWGDAALDTDLNRLLVTGGGGGDYSGNEVYSIPLDGPPVSILKPQSELPADIGNCPLSWPDPDGVGEAPASRHTYGNLAYIPVAGSRTDPFLFLVSGARSLCDSFVPGDTWLLNLTTNEWAKLGEIGPSAPMRCQYSPGRDSVICIYDSNGWLSVSEFIVETQAWSEVYDGTSILNVQVEPGHGAAWVEATETWWLVGSGVVATFEVPTLAYTEKTTTGGLPIVNSDDPGVDFHSGRGTIVAWNSSDPSVMSDTVYELDRSTLEWTVHTGVGPVLEDNTGVYGRWRYVPALDKMVALPATNQNAYLFSFGAGGSPPAQVTGVSVSMSVFSALLAQCEDGIDNDGDGLVDLADPGCTSSSDDDETDLPVGSISFEGVIGLAQGNSTADFDATPCPTGQCKHVRQARRSVDGRWYFFGGDHINSGQNRVWALDPSTESFSLEYPDCSGSPQPNEPDEWSWVWDTTRDQGWATPGGDQGGNCATALSQKVWTFHPDQPTGNKYVNETDDNLIDPPHVVFGNSPGAYKNGIYDPVRDEIVIFNDSFVYIYDISLDSWSKVSTPGAFRIRNNNHALDLGRRVVFVYSSYDAKIGWWDLDSQTFTTVHSIPQTNLYQATPIVANWALYDSQSDRVILVEFDDRPDVGLGLLRLHVYDPNTQTIEMDVSYPAATGCGSFSCDPKANHAFYDEVTDFIYVYGNVWTGDSQPFIFKYRYQ